MKKDSIDLELLLDSIADTEESKEGEEDLNKNKILENESLIAPSDWTVETILSQLRKQNIDLNPNFQRRGAWTERRKSRFIESLFLGLPIPQIVLATNKKEKGKFIVIDGKQRLLSIIDFAMPKNNRGRLKLKDLQFFPELNNKTYEEIKNDPSICENIDLFENQTIRTVVIKNWQDEQFLYLNFLRLNTGSLPLSPQELRQALMPGPFTNFVNDITERDDMVTELLNKKEPDFRMRDVELIIRFYAFKLFKNSYKGNLKEFLDSTCDNLNRNFDKNLITRLYSGLFLSIDIAKSIFSEANVFRKWNADGYEGRFNRAIYDIMVYYFSEPSHTERFLEKKVEIENGFKHLCSTNVEFKKSLETTTKSLKATDIRFSLWKDTLEKVCNIKID